MCVYVCAGGGGGGGGGGGVLRGMKNADVMKMLM